MNINQVQNNNKVKKALRDARRIATKPINLKALDEWDGQHQKSHTGLKSAFLDDNKNSFDVYVGGDLPIHMAIHEILHTIIISENYPELIFDADASRRSCEEEKLIQDEKTLIALYNKFIHLEIYRRMKEVYGLSMEFYQKQISNELEHLAKKQFLNGGFKTSLGKQIQVFNALDLMALGDEGQKSLEFFKENANDVYKATNEAFTEVMSIGLSTPELAVKAGNALLKQIISYGDNMGNDATNDLWKALKWEAP